MGIISAAKLKKMENRHAPEISRQTGFPSPATHYMEAPIDLHKELMIHKDATFYVRVDGDAWKEHNILDKDVLIVDRSLHLRDNNLALVTQDGEFRIVRHLKKEPQQPYELWGVITYIIHYAR